MQKTSILNNFERVTGLGSADMIRIGIALSFLLLILMVAGQQIINVPNGTMLIAAAVIGGYMALNIGANDVANNVGPAVGAKALSLVGAIAIAAFFEAGGAIIAGGDVVSTVKKGIINPELFNNAQEFIWLMMAALLAGAFWLNIATATGTPVSTTHSIVGGVLGAGMAAGGLDVINWDKLAQIVASWVVSPVMGGLIAALFLYIIKRTITYKKDVISAAHKVVPILIGLMAWAFSTYLLIKGVKKIVTVGFIEALIYGFLIATTVFVVMRKVITGNSVEVDNKKEAISHLFTIPLICSAALLSFAHGANDVANAIGPLAAISDSVLSGEIKGKAEIPLWIMLIGAIGISLGLALFGPKLIRVVGTEITELDQTRAYCIAMAASITVIIASQLGLPISSTHVAVGAVFGVGFLREAIKANYATIIQDIKEQQTQSGHTEEEVKNFLDDFEKAAFEEKTVLLKQLKKNTAAIELAKKERKRLKKVHREHLVKRSAVLKIAAAWVITVPASAFMAAFFYFTIRGMLLP